MAGFVHQRHISSWSPVVFLVPSITQATTFRQLVSALNLKRECPRSLPVALDATHPNQQIWLDSFCKEKTGIQSQNTYIKIGLKDY
jgi:hypothetical protein